MNDLLEWLKRQRFAEEFNLLNRYTSGKRQTCETCKSKTLWCLTFLQKVIYTGLAYYTQSHFTAVQPIVIYPTIISCSEYHRREVPTNHFNWLASWQPNVLPTEAVRTRRLSSLLQGLTSAQFKFHLPTAYYQHNNVVIII